MILITGSTGFLGRQIIKCIGQHHVKTLSRHNADYEVNLKDEVAVLSGKFDIVIHAAGKAHVVPKTEAEKKDFFDVNVAGTQNLLKAIDALPDKTKAFVLISTVAVYGKESGTNINEDTALLANDAYGLSKVQTEQLVQQWCINNNVICTILRLPLIAGPNPPGNLGAMIDAIKKGYYFNIAGGHAKKSMVLATDVAKIILKTATIGGIYNLTDGRHPSFFELGNYIAMQLNKKTPYNIPYPIAKLMAIAGDMIGKRSPINSDKLKKITSDLTFDDSKAVKHLAWQPTPVTIGLQV